jgi:hypothetical protein
MDSYATMPVKFMIQKAIAPDKKTYPKIMLHAIIASLATFFLILIVLLLMDKIKKEIRLDSKPENSTKQE